MRLLVKNRKPVAMRELNRVADVSAELVTGM